MSSSSSSQSGAVRFGDFPFDAHVKWAEERAQIEQFENTLGSAISSPSAYVIPQATQMAVTHPTNVSLLDQILGINLKKELVSIDEPPFYSSQLLGSLTDSGETLFGSSAYLQQQEETVKNFAEQQGDIENPEETRGEIPQEKIIQPRKERGEQGDSEEEEEVITPTDAILEQKIAQQQMLANQSSESGTFQTSLPKERKKIEEIQTETRQRISTTTIAQEAKILSALFPLISTRMSEKAFIQSKMGQLRQA